MKKKVRRQKVKSVEGSMIETQGSLETRIIEGELSVPYRLQLVSKQVDLKGDGILGRDFFKATQARICYREQALIFQYKGTFVRKKLTSLRGVELGTSGDRKVNKLTLPARTELIVQVPVNARPWVREGLIERAEPVPGVYMAESLVKVRNGHIITSILNTREQEVEIPSPEVHLTELEHHNRDEAAVIGRSEQDMGRGDQSLSRGERVVDSLRTDHLNDEERKSLRELCFDYQDVFYLPGDRLSATNAARHTIQLEPGVSPINTHPYRLPESQKEEVDRQVKQLLEEGIIAKSESPWNSPLLVVPKKAGPDGKEK